MIGFRGFLLGLAASLCLARPAGAAVTHWVDPFIGTEGTGHTFPGAAVPFGMVAPSPDTADAGWDHASGYRHRAPRILGFSNSHMSGTGIGELGDVLLQPAAGVAWSSRTTDFSAAHDPHAESARPGYYGVRLADHHVRVELTATPRVAIHRYTFDAPGRVQVLVDLGHVIHFREGPRATRAQSEVTAEGLVTGSAHLVNWAERDLAFAVRFDHPIVATERLAGRDGDPTSRYLLTFDLKQGRVLEVRIALSTTDVAGALGNLATARPVSFERAAADADRAWEDLLGRVRLEAASRQKRIFYTALYHAFLHPSDIADADGRVRGADGAIIEAPGGHYYSTLSLWDISRAAFPLLTLLAPERVDGIIQTLLAHERQQGYLPIWPVWGRETWCMIGNPSLPVIAHALAAGFTGFDREQALAAMVTSSTAPRTATPLGVQRDWNDYERFGYLPYDGAEGEAVSRTLEYAWGDDAVARVAAKLGRTDIAARFARRAAGYRQLYDSETGMMRGRSADGAWRTPFDPLKATSPLNNPGDYTEANAYQYTATPALYDPEGMVSLLGGAEATGRWLDRFFATGGPPGDRYLGQEGVIGQYAQGNEPSHHIAYFYAWTDRPWHGHARLNEIASRFYTDSDDGIPGNDDAGQLSAWYVLAVLGLYPMVPASGEYVLAAPLVRAAELRLAGGAVLRVAAAGFGADRTYARSVTWRGQTYRQRTIPYRDVAAGGTLRFAMVQAPD